MLKHLLIGGFLIAASAAAFGEPHGPRGVFENADANGDGMIARDEFLAARAAAFAKIDQNSDGVIDDADRRDSAREGGRRAGMRGRMDANSDGKISKEEFVDGATPMFDRADADGNGSVDAKELEAARERLRERRKDRER